MGEAGGEKLEKKASRGPPVSAAGFVDGAQRGRIRKNKKGSDIQTNM